LTFQSEVPIMITTMKRALPGDYTWRRSIAEASSYLLHRDALQRVDGLAAGRQ